MIFFVFIMQLFILYIQCIQKCTLYLYTVCTLYLTYELNVFFEKSSIFFILYLQLLIECLYNETLSKYLPIVVEKKTDLFPSL